MPRGNWYAILALAGIALGYPVQQACYAQSGSAENQSDAAHNIPPSPANSIQDQLARIASAIETAKTDPESEASQDRAKRDLDAQEDMAKWAMWMFIVAGVSTILSVIGIGLIWRTLFHTRRAATHAGVGSRLSRRALAHMQNASRAELRPYLFIDKIDTVQKGERYYNVTIWYKNFGKTPARDILSTTMCYTTEDIADLQDFTSDDTIAAGIAGPDNSRRTFAAFFFTEKQWESDGPQETYVILRVAYTYRDESGGSYSEAVDFYSSPHHLKQEDGTFFLLTEDAKERHREAREKQETMFKLLQTPRRRRSRKKKKPEGAPEGNESGEA